MPAWRLIGFRGAAELAGLAAGAIAFIWVARLVGPSVMGDLAVATAVSQLGLVFIAAGTGSTAPTLVAMGLQPPSDTWWATVVIRTIAASSFVILLLTSVPIVLPAGPLAQYSSAITATWLLAPLRSDWLLVATGDITGASYSRGISLLAMAAVAIAFIDDAGDAALVPLIVAVPGVVYPVTGTALCAMRGLLQRPPTSERAMQVVRSTLEGAWHYVTADLSAFVFSGLDRLILYAVASPAATGLYEAAYRVVQPVYLLSTVANDAMFRSLASTSGTAAKEVVRRYGLLMLAATMPIGAFLMLFGGFVVDLVYGDEFSAAAPILGLLGWVITIGFVSGTMILPMVPWREPATYARSTFAAAVTSVAGNLILAPGFAGFGAAITAILAKAASGLVARKTFDRRSPVPIWALTRPFAIAVAAATTLAYLSGLIVPPFIAIAIFVVGYVLTLSAALFLPRLHFQTATDS